MARAHCFVVEYRLIPFSRSHYSEKQYTCQYCPNRFKNKNEAERHQNSLHLRQHSWSCAGLSGIENTFHTNDNNATDACGFCGQDFPNPPQWDVRRDHLNVIHKYGDCNRSKKFYRADHFRQHLKHSHGGTSGKWTNVLEQACMRDEPPPQPFVRGPVGASAGIGTMVSAQSLPSIPVLSVAGPATAPGEKPETIDESSYER